MKFWVWVAAAMVAFAANSILNRAAVGGDLIDAYSFAFLRAASGALTLLLLVRLQRRPLQRWSSERLVGAGPLALYLLCFSMAYSRIDSGVGALLLFAAVQVTMFAGGVLGGERPPLRRWVGALAAMGGLGWLIWPSGPVALPLGAAFAMLAAGVGWGLYSLRGRQVRDALTDTAANFVVATPICALPFGFLSDSAVFAAPSGVVLAVVSGAVTSGLGYALWYAVLPRIGASVAGLVQLSVPVIATLGGVFLLAETLSVRALTAGVVVLGGIAYGLSRPALADRVASAD